MNLRPKQFPDPDLNRIQRMKRWIIVFRFHPPRRRDRGPYLRRLNENKGIRKEDMPTFEFDTKQERDNFISYCKTDFVRFCLVLYKNNQHVDSKELTLVPWLDFTQQWNDEKLYNLFNVNKETINYIEEFLPDYHNIRKNNG